VTDRIALGGGIWTDDKMIEVVRAGPATKAKNDGDFKLQSFRLCPGKPREFAQTRAGRPALPRLRGRIEVALVWLWGPNRLAISRL
jgi:hypothetical protein